MIADRNMNPTLLFNFFNEVSGDLPLDEPIKKLGLTLSEYSKKLAEKATIAYEMQDEKLISCVIGYTHNLPPDQGGYITQVATCKEHRNKGLTSRLLGEFVEEAKEDGVRFLWLTTGLDNRAAQHTYEKAGFLSKGIIENQLTGKTVLRYERKLVD